MKLTSILVPLAGTAIDPDVIEFAIALGRQHKAKITAVHVIEVKWNMPLDAVLDAELERGEEILALAEKVAEKLGSHLVTEVLQARQDIVKLDRPEEDVVAQFDVQSSANGHCEVILRRREAAGQVSSAPLGPRHLWTAVPSGGDAEPAGEFPKAARRGSRGAGPA